MFLTEDYINSLTEDEAQLIAAQNYQEGQTLSQFYDDWSRFGHVQKLLSRYKKSGKLNVRLLINHFVILSNIFGPKITKVVLFQKVKIDFWPELKTALVFLSYMQEDEMPTVGMDNETWETISQQ